jgi:hypothetical protein
MLTKLNDLKERTLHFICSSIVLLVPLFVFFDADFRHLKFVYDVFSHQMNEPEQRAVI